MSRQEQDGSQSEEARQADRELKQILQAFQEVLEGVVPQKLHLRGITLSQLAREVRRLRKVIVEDARRRGMRP